jgi:TP901 family phage tail tape measure protein
VADYNLGTAKGKIAVEYDGKGAAAAKKDIGEVGKTSTSSAAEMRRAGIVTGAASGAIAAGLVLAAHSAIDFEHRISAIAAVSGATGADIEALRKKALQLGADTAFSAGEAAQAMEELAKAGIALPDILNGAADATVALAAAGGVDLPAAAELAANAMNAFGLSARDMPKVADLIAGAANASAIDVGEFGLALKQAGAVAHLVGLDFHDTAVAIALLGNAGIKGSDAGTSLKTMLSNLQPQTKKQIDLFKQLNLVTASGANVFFDARGNIKKLADISQILQDRLSGMTAAQKQMTLEMIFGSDAIRAAAILTQAGAKGFNSMAAAMGKVKAADVAAKRLDNVSGAIEQLKGSAETLAITVGSVMLPTIKIAANVLTVVANRISSLPEPVAKAVVGIAILTSGVLGLVSAFALLKSINLAETFAALFNPVTLAIVAAAVAVGLIVLGIQQAAKRSAEFRNAIFSVRDAVVGNFAPAFAEVAQTIARQVLPRIREVDAFVRAKLADAMQRIQQIIYTQIIPALADMRDWWDRNKDSIEPIIGDVAKIAEAGAKLAVVLTALSVVGDFVALAVVLRSTVTALEGISSAGSAVVGVVHSIVDTVTIFVARLNEARTASTGVVASISSGFASVVAPVQAAIGFLIEVIRTFWSGVFALVSIGMALVRGAVGNQLAVLMAVWNRFWSIFGEPIKTAAAIIISVVTWLTGVIRGLFSVGMADVSSRVRLGMATIAAIFNELSAVLRTVRGFFDGLRGAASGGVGSLISFVAAIPGRIVAALGDLGGRLYGAGRAIADGFVRGIESGVDRVLSAARRLADAVPNAVKRVLGIASPSKVAIALGREVPRGLALGVLRNVDLVRRASEEASRALARAIAVVPSDTSASVSLATSSASFGGAAIGAPTPPPPAPAIGSAPVINQTFNVPAPMNEKELAAYAARRLVIGVEGATSTASV